ncbi:hypothetical protein BP6252_02467 [Coleophoma cylindrospora]|uniref:Zn(2)-C6 fungal-type domain-containing protein n=1 Tax=Coleophoma cylindrospora TaxID=1849047 RepID=A0A3D8SEV3_9HELO|nr:hypothetical protein BP6252_02467 [Coleophoma cylindrospora]
MEATIKAVDVPRPSQRKGSRKVRTGCITCKIRRVKCDERKDGCLRCEKFGTQCDGYVSEKQYAQTRALAPRIQVQSTYPAGWRVPIPRLAVSEASDAIALVNSPAVPLSITQLASKRLFENPQQHRFFQSFSDQCSYQLTGCFESAFWNRLVLQASEQEPSIRHAIIALGALDPASFGASTDPSDAVKDDTDPEASRLALAQRYEKQQYAIAEYMKSIRIMRKTLDAGERNIRSMLIACLLFTCFESMCNNHDSALGQVQGGFNMLDNWYFSQGSSKNDHLSAFGIRSPSPGILEDDLLQAFNRMDIQVMTALDMRSTETHESMQFCGQDNIDSMPLTLQDVKEARVYMELIMRRQLHFEAATMRYSHRRGPPTKTDPRRSITIRPKDIEKEGTQPPKAHKRKPGAKPPLTSTEKRPNTIQNPITKPLVICKYKVIDQILGTSPPIPRYAIQDQARHVLDLEIWHTRFKPVLEHARGPQGKDVIFAATTVQMHYLAAKYSILSALFTTQTPYDQFLPLFQEQIQLTEELLSHRDYSAKNGTFTFDCQIVMPLFACGLKCRNGEMRRKCIELLERSSRHEGLWDGGVASKVLRWVMAVEEEDLIDGDIIAENNRIRGVRMFFDPQDKVLKMRCLRPSRDYPGMLDILEGTGESLL